MGLDMEVEVDTVLVQDMTPNQNLTQIQSMSHVLNLTQNPNMNLSQNQSMTRILSQNLSMSPNMNNLKKTHYGKKRLN
jgi:hypothetical protein